MATGPKLIQMDSRITPPATNGAGRRKCQSWIDSFIESTDNLDAPAIFRKWAAITTIAAVVEQKVWLKSGGGILYPNLYVFLVGHPGVGKTRTVRASKSYLLEIPDFHLAPTSVTAASLVDSLLAAKRMLVRLPDPPLEYNSMMISADELGTFIHKYDDEMIAVLSAFYDPDPYGHNRRGKEIKIKIQSPQLNILCGTTPSNLLKFMPEGAWDQGFTSRTIMVFSDERIVGDDFRDSSRAISGDLLHDLKLINSIVGQFSVSEDYRNLVNLWRAQGEAPSPSHPKLLHYCTRRRAHLYKLSMVAALERSNALTLTRDDFNRAIGWMHEAEAEMPEIFKAGSTGADGQAMDEIYHYIMMIDMQGKGVLETLIVNEARKKIPAHSVMRMMDVMERSGLIKAISLDAKTGLRRYVAVPKVP